METFGTLERNSSPSQKKRKKLLSLTFLRFVAASLIVVLHLEFEFIKNNNWFPLDSAVSFFYILSGFILTYSYPSLQSRASVIHFYKARFARIYPTYIASTIILFIIYVLFLGIFPVGKSFFFYITMTQAWIPSANYYFSYIGAAWSVSDEIFFYLLFPLLIKNFRHNWYIKLLLSIITSICVIWFTNLLCLPIYNLKGGITEHGLICISPVIRILEFIWGMCIGLIFDNFASISRLQYFNRKLVSLGTLIEIAAIILPVAVAKGSSQIIKIINFHLPLGTAGNQWFEHGKLLMIPYGILILIFALNIGWISKFISKPIFIYLGEISFSIYLIHQPCMIILAHVNRFKFLPSFISLSAFLLIVLVLSHLMFKFVESPCRKLIIGFGTRARLQNPK